MKDLIITAFLFMSVLIAGLVVGPQGSVFADEKGKASASGDRISVEQVYAKKESLNGQTITVQGEVVKFNGSIMGKNWVHIKDGSGMHGTNDLTVTTQDTAAPGDKVVATGTLVTGKDFGSGYKFQVILENATLTPLK